MPGRTHRLVLADNGPVTSTWKVAANLPARRLTKRLSITMASLRLTLGPTEMTLTGPLVRVSRFTVPVDRIRSVQAATSGPLARGARFDLEDGDVWYVWVRNEETAAEIVSAAVSLGIRLAPETYALPLFRPGPDAFAAREL